MKSATKNIKLEDYIHELRSKGKFTVNFQELKTKFTDRSTEALRQAVFRMKSNHSLAHLRREFYLVIPPEYSANAGLPLYLFIDDLMKFLEREYYVGLFSAAALHGASHQSSMINEVIVNKTPLRPIVNDNINIKFHVKKEIQFEHIIKMKSDSGYFSVSSPELTALDLIFYSKEWGVERTLSVLSELKENIKPSVLYNCALNYDPVSVKKLGFLMDEYFNDDKLSVKLHSVYSKNKSTGYTYLSSSAEKEGEKIKKWEIIKNINLGGMFDT